jgi:hypothetical protein
MTRRFADERGSAITLIAEVLGIIASILGIWQFGVSVGFIDGPGPIQIVQDAVDPPTPSPFPSDGPDGIEGLQRLDSPTGVDVSDCLLSWDQVDGAESYRIERDGFPFSSTTDTSIDLTTLPGADGQTHEFGVIASPPPLGGIESLPSKPESADC